LDVFFIVSIRLVNDGCLVLVFVVMIGNVFDICSGVMGLFLLGFLMIVVSIVWIYRREVG